MPSQLRGDAADAIAKDPRLLDHCADAMAWYINQLPPEESFALYGCGGLAKTLIRDHGSCLEGRSFLFTVTKPDDDEVFEGHKVHAAAGLRDRPPERIILTSHAYKAEMMANVEFMGPNQVVTVDEMLRKALSSGTLSDEILRSADPAEVDLGPEVYACSQLEMAMFLSTEEVRSCCSNLTNEKFPILQKLPPGTPVDLDQIVAAKHALRAKHRRGEISEACVGCPNLRLMRLPDREYLFADINISHFTQCHLACIYCRTHCGTAPYPVKVKDAQQLLPFFRKVIDEGYLDPHAHIRFGGGEPTMLPEFEEILALFHGYGSTRIWMQTNAVLIAPGIERILALDPKDPQRLAECRTTLMISLDAATSATYRKVKARDCCDLVWDNVAAYARINPNPIVLKHIVLPENCGEGGLFVRRAHAIGVRRIGYAVDATSYSEGRATTSEEIIDTIAELIIEGERLGVDVEMINTVDPGWLREKGDKRLASRLREISSPVK